ncbi:MAG: glycine zipper 2TM domain-containing protein [Sphingomonadales bacterium]|nr:glycine zipper 2TM domain-containing protein [Sphingomonadales bacterium]
MMTTSRLSRTLLSIGALSSAALPLLAAPALAQSGPIGRTTVTTSTTTSTTTTQDIDPRLGSYAPRDSRDGYYANGAPRDPLPYPEPAPPPGYDGSALPPPPPGYQPYGDDRARTVADDRYGMEAERWARDNCVKSQGNAAGGALIGGLLGAIVGSSVAGWHDRGAGALIGGAFGAVGGAAIGSASDNETSPGCPPGYRVRRDAVVYAYDGPEYAYAAPGWYRPWVFIGGSWTYRPYPYHDWYYRTYRGYRPEGGYRYRSGPESWRGHRGW